MFKLMGKVIIAILGAQTILIWTYEFTIVLLNPDLSFPENSTGMNPGFLDRGFKFTKGFWIC